MLRVGLHETVVCERFLNVQTSKQRGKKLAVGRGPLAAGPPPMIQTAQSGTVTIDHVPRGRHVLLIKSEGVLQSIQRSCRRGTQLPWKSHE